MTCKKRSYASRAAAQSFADRFIRRGGDLTRPYLCLECGRWHLTHLAFWKIVNTDEARRMVADQQGREIDADLKAWAEKLAEEIAADMEATIATAILDAIDRWRQREALKAVGVGLG
jgi:hypothetical protein